MKFVSISSFFFWVVLALVLAFAWTACGDVDDDAADDGDAGGDDDSSPSDYSWPDNPGPMEGWYAIAKSQTRWGIYLARGQAVSGKQEPTDDPFRSGMLVDAQTGIAVTKTELVELHDDAWHVVTDAPSCNSFIGQPVIDAAGTIVAFCFEPSGRLIREDGAWREEDLPGGPYLGAQCLDPDHCVVWGAYDSKTCSRAGCKSVADGPAFADEFQDIVWVDEATLFALRVVGDSEDRSLEPAWYDQTTGEWTAEERPSAGTFFEGSIARVSAAFVAFSYYAGNDERGTYIIPANVDQDLVVNDWPLFDALAFSPNGGGYGIAYQGGQRVLFEVNGLDIIPWREIDGYPTGFLAAADAE
jgi:hypothetical protein